MIRIISGAYKGRRLKFVRDLRVRPIQDKLKGALFNILNERIQGSSFLDGFSGTGSVGLEALSRGAQTAVFVDEFYPAVKAIRANIAKCGAEDRSVVLHQEFNRAVIGLSKDKVRFDVIFLDPPYKLLEERNPMKVVRKRAILKPGGILILRYHVKTPPASGDFDPVRSVKIGDDVLAFYRPLPAEAKK